MKSRIIALGLFTLLTVGVPPIPMRTGSAKPMVKGPSQHIDTSRRTPEGDACGIAPVGEAER